MASQAGINKMKHLKKLGNKSDNQIKINKIEQNKYIIDQIDSPKVLSDSLRHVDISFNENDIRKAVLPKHKNELQNIAYETQLKFSQLILSPKGQELKKKEEERRKNEGNQLNHHNIEFCEVSKKFHKQLHEKKEQHDFSDDTNINCVICFENEPDTVYLPCGHGGICYECAMDVMKKTGECYLCRNEISQVVQIDFKSKDVKKKIIAVTAQLESEGTMGNISHSSHNQNSQKTENDHNISQIDQVNHDNSIVQHANQNQNINNDNQIDHLNQENNEQFNNNQIEIQIQNGIPDDVHLNPQQTIVPHQSYFQKEQEQQVVENAQKESENIIAESFSQNQHNEIQSEINVNMLIDFSSDFNNQNQDSNSLY